MLAARQCISKESDELPDIIFAYGCKASEEDVEAAVFAKTGLRTPWIKDSFSTFMKNFEKRIGIVTWELVPEAGRTIAEKEECLKAALDYLEFKKIELVRSFSFSFQAIDPNDDLIDDEEMADHIYLDTGFKSEWYPHRISDCEDVTEVTEVHCNMKSEVTEVTEIANNTITEVTEIANNTITEVTEVTEVAKRRIGRPPKPITCPDCNMVFRDKYAKRNHKRSGKCSAK
jgi:hypothetical protein